MTLIGTGLRVISEWQGRRLTLGVLRARLETSGQALVQRMQQAHPSARSLEQTRHIIGIERWGQARLKSLLGGPVLNDEYDGYRPDDLATMPALAAAMLATRAETVALVQALQAAGKTGAETVRHNELGDLSVGGWLVYLHDHAKREGYLIR